MSTRLRTTAAGSSSDTNPVDVAAVQVLVAEPNVVDGYPELVGHANIADFYAVQRKSVLARIR